MFAQVVEGSRRFLSEFAACICCLLTPCRRNKYPKTDDEFAQVKHDISEIIQRLLLGFSNHGVQWNEEVVVHEVVAEEEEEEEEETQQNGKVGGADSQFK